MAKKNMKWVLIKAVSNGFVVTIEYTPMSAGMSTYERTMVFRDFGEVQAWLRLCDNRWV